MENTRYLEVFVKGLAAFYFHQEVVRALWQRWMTQTLVIVMRQLEKKLSSHTPLSLKLITADSLRTVQAGRRTLFTTHILTLFMKDGDKDFWSLSILEKLKCKNFYTFLLNVYSIPLLLYFHYPKRRALIILIIDFFCVYLKYSECCSFSDVCSHPCRNNDNLSMR